MDFQINPYLYYNPVNKYNRHLSTKHNYRKDQLLHMVDHQDLDL